MHRSIGRLAQRLRTGLARAVIVCAALAGLSCATSMTPYWSVPRPERLHALSTVAIAPMMIRSFGLDSGVAYDTSTLPFRVLHDRLARSFVPVLLPPSAFSASRAAPSLDEVVRAAAQQGGVDAVLVAEFRYVTTHQEFQAELHLKVLDLEDCSVIAELGEEKGQYWQGFLGEGDNPAEAVRMVIELAVRRLEIYRARHAS
jgi:hypothetical protein